MKLPAFQFYPGDWMKDPDLRRCSLAARGVWVDMLCLMFECEQRGVLATGGSPWSRTDVAQAVGGNGDVTLRCIDELVAKGVCKVREDGALYSKRQVEDEEKRAETRQRVANHREKHSCNAVSNASVTPTYQPSSSSVSSSASAAEEPPVALGHERNRSMPPILESIPGFRDAWERWMVDLSARNRGKSPTIFQLQMHLAKLTKIAEAGQSPIEAIDNGIARALREPDLPLKGNTPAPRNEPPPTRITE